MLKTICRAQGVLLVLSCHAFAQGYRPVHEVRGLPGWRCMALASAYGPNGINAPPAPVFAGPESDAQRVGGAAGTIIVPSPVTTTDGRTRIVRPNGTRVWIASSALTPWHALSDPNATCTPALMSNGRYGFSTRH